MGHYPEKRWQPPPLSGVVVLTYNAKLGAKLRHEILSFLQQAEQGVLAQAIANTRGENRIAAATPSLEAL
jgi:hypothetical protein